MRLLRDPLVLLLGALLFFESGNEFIVGGYATTLLTRELGTSVATASYALAGFWAALMAARLWLGGAGARPTGPRLVVASAALSALAVSVLVVATQPGPGDRDGGRARGDAGRHLPGGAGGRFRALPGAHRARCSGSCSRWR